MTFNPSQKLVIGVHPKKVDTLIITCPFWGNDLLTDVPKRWDKSARAWSVPAVRQSVAIVEEKLRIPGAVFTPEADALILDVKNRAKKIGKRGEGFPPWYKFKTPPRKHQAAGIEKMYGLRAGALFMDMQTGKSWVAINLTAAHRMEGHVEAMIVLVKRTLRRNWIDQLEEHCPIPFSAHLPEVSDPRTFARWFEFKHDFKVLLAGWESLSAGALNNMIHQFIDHYKGKVAIVGDETTYIANSQATRSKTATELSHACDYRYALTGTPALEGPMNLYSQFEFLDPNIIGIGDFLAFRNRYAVMGGYRREIAPGKKVATEIVGYTKLEELMGLIAPFTFQVDKKQVYDLPPKRYEIREIELSAEQRRIYDQIKREGFIQIEGHAEHIVENTLELMLRLHQVTGGWSVAAREKKWIGKDKNGNPEPRVKMVYDPVELIVPEKNPKIVEVQSIFEELRHKKQGIVWAVYMPEILAMVKRLRAMGFRVGELHGGIPDPDRQPIVREYQKGGFDLIVGNASTGGMGYTLMRSTVNVFYNNTHKAIDRVQAEDRAWGDGQTEPGVWIDLTAKKTVERTILRALAEKQDLGAYIKHRIKEITQMLDGE